MISRRETNRGRGAVVVKAGAAVGDAINDEKPYIRGI
jgi:hypothetical protein